jgi:hypothetical protein
MLPWPSLIAHVCPRFTFMHLSINGQRRGPAIHFRLQTRYKNRTVLLSETERWNLQRYPPPHKSHVNLKTGESVDDDVLPWFL